MTSIDFAPRDLLWPLLLAVAAVGGSWLFACVMPFAAFAAILAETERRDTALITMALIWAANQAVGFATLGYPTDAHSLSWGVAIGVAALAGTLAATIAVSRCAHLARWARLVIAFAAAFVVYQGVLTIFAAAVAEMENFTPTLIAQIALADAGWLLGLAALHEALAALGWPHLTSLRRAA